MSEVQEEQKTKYATILTTDDGLVLCKSGQFIGERVIGPENRPGIGEEVVYTPEKVIEVSDEPIRAREAVYRALDIYDGGEEE